MNKKKAKILVIGKKQNIKEMQHQESQRWCSPTLRRITSSRVTITW
jgi:hypothetical protein